MQYKDCIAQNKYVAQNGKYGNNTKIRTVIVWSKTKLMTVNLINIIILCYEQNQIQCHILQRKGQQGMTIVNSTT